MGGSSPRRGQNSKAGKIKESCDDLVIHTQLKSPSEEVISKLSRGDDLIIDIVSGLGCVAKHDNEIAGKIVCIELSQLLDCVRSGNQYIAEIRNISGLRCSLTIRKRP